jgi:hypothetical protein
MYSFFVKEITFSRLSRGKRKESFIPFSPAGNSCQGGAISSNMWSTVPGFSSLPERNFKKNHPGLQTRLDILFHLCGPLHNHTHSHTHLTLFVSAEVKVDPADFGIKLRKTSYMLFLYIFFINTYSCKSVL